MSASKQVTLPVMGPNWGLIDCWSGYTQSALEYAHSGLPVAYGQGRIHIHWGILWASRPTLFHLNMHTSARGSNNWIPGEYNFVQADPCAPLDSLSPPQVWQSLGIVLDLYNAQWHGIDQLVDSGEWVADTYEYKHGSIERRECSHNRITRSLLHLFETGALNPNMLY